MRKMLLLALVFVACTTATPSHEPPCPPSWRYDQQQQWPPACLTGSERSPIDITTSRLVTEPVLTVGYRSFVPMKYNNERGVKFIVRTPGAGGGITIVEGGRQTNYTLYEMHFHVPGEHRFNGTPAPMELHLVHKDLQGNQKIVITVLFDNTAQLPNLGLDEIIPLFPTASCRYIDAQGSVDPTKLLPDRDHRDRYYVYDGALTTPDCDPGLRFFVFDARVNAKREQWLAISQRIAPNAKTVAVRQLPNITLVAPPSQ
jgi:carbonic anhydrase